MGIVTKVYWVYLRPELLKVSRACLSNKLSVNQGIDQCPSKDSAFMNPDYLCLLHAR